MDYPSSGEGVAPAEAAAAECLSDAAVAVEALVVGVEVQPLLFPQSLSDAVIRSAAETRSSDDHGSHLIAKTVLTESLDWTTYSDYTVT